MIVLLKIILALIGVADCFALWSVWKDFQLTKKRDGYDELSIWNRVKFNLTMFFMMSGMISLLTFLIYFIIIKISLG